MSAFWEMLVSESLGEINELSSLIVDAMKLLRSLLMGDVVSPSGLSDPDSLMKKNDRVVVGVDKVSGCVVVDDVLDVNAH